jgi:O-antigen/teichoic acid export membrane protein
MWTASRAAVFTRLNGGRRWSELKSLFDRSVKHSVVTYAVAVAGLIAGQYIVNDRYPSVASRLLDPLSTLLLVAGGGFALLSFFIAYFVRSFKEEPFVRMAWINAVLVVILLPAGILWFHTRGASAAYVVSQALVFPFAWQIYTKYRKRMQSNLDKAQLGTA